MRRKNFLIGIIILVFSPLLFANNCKGEVMVGDVFNYKITKAKIYAKVGEDFVKARGFQLNRNSYPTSSSIQFTVSYVSEFISGRFRIDNETHFSSFGSEIYTSLIPLYMRYPSVVAYNLVYQCDIYNLELGMFFNIIPFINPSVENFNYFTALGENFISTCESNFTNQPKVTYDYTLDNSTENIYFESWLGGDLVGNYASYLGGLDGTPELYLADLSFGNNFQILINKTTGIVIGMGYRGWTKGLLNQSSVKVSMEYEYEFEGYNLPRYNYGVYHNYLIGYKFFYG